MSGIESVFDHVPHNGDSPEPCPACIEAPAVTGGGEPPLRAPAHASYRQEQEQAVWAVARELCVAIEQAGKRLAEAGVTVDEAGELLSECVVLAHWEEHFDG